MDVLREFRSSCRVSCSLGLMGYCDSRAQFIPEISQDVSVEVINFCRTPQWFIPRVCSILLQRIRFTDLTLPILGGL